MGHQRGDPDNITSLHEFAGACSTEKVNRDRWVTKFADSKLRLRDNEVSNDLRSLTEGELQPLGTTSSKSVAPSDPGTTQQLL